MEAPKDVCQLIECRNASLFCETFNCRTPAKYHLCRPDGPMHLRTHLCEACAKSMIEYLPKELLTREMAVCDCKKDEVCGKCMEDKRVYHCSYCFAEGELRLFSNKMGADSHIKAHARRAA